MHPPPNPSQQREFRCVHCKGLIRIPADLPPTTGPCPHCATSITSPGPDELCTVEQEPFASASAEEKPISCKATKIRSAGEWAVEEEHQETTRSYLAAVIGLLAVALAIVLGGTLALREMKKPPVIPEDKAVAENDAVRQAHYIRTGWKKEAYQVLDSFMNGTTAQEKIPHVLHGDAISQTMEAFYGEGPINDSDTPAETFSAFNLSEEDRKRGLFLLVFDQPPQFSMRDFFRPLASLEVQHGLTEADLLLSSMARVSNFSTDPMRVHAFFRKTPDGLKLDWDIFAQTKYSMLQKFLENPQIGKKQVFRVFITEDVHDPRFSIVISRTYRIADPAHTDHTARIVVPLDSDVGRELSVINWVGIEGKKPVTRNATVELEWRGSGNQPYLAIKRFLCWEFWGLGGGEGSAQPEAPTSEDP